MIIVVLNDERVNVVNQFNKRNMHISMSNPCTATSVLNMSHCPATRPYYIRIK